MSSSRRVSSRLVAYVLLLGVYNIFYSRTHNAHTRSWRETPRSRLRITFIPLFFVWRHTTHNASRRILPSETLEPFRKRSIWGVCVRVSLKSLIVGMRYDCDDDVSPFHENRPFFVCVRVWVRRSRLCVAIPSGGVIQHPVCEPDDTHSHTQCVAT